MRVRVCVCACARVRPCAIHCVARARHSTHTQTNKQTNTQQPTTGPLSPPLLGDLGPMLRVGLHEYVTTCAERYGAVFKIYLG